MELAGQVLDQLPEIHPVVGGKIEHQLVAVQRILGVHQLHLQLVGGDALFAQVKGGLFVGAVLAHPADVDAVGHAHHRLDFPGKTAGGDVVDAAHHLAALDAAGGLDNHIVPVPDGQVPGVKVVGPAAFLEFD